MHAVLVVDDQLRNSVGFTVGAYTKRDRDRDRDRDRKKEIQCQCKNIKKGIWVTAREIAFVLMAVDYHHLV